MNPPRCKLLVFFIVTALFAFACSAVSSTPTAVPPTAVPPTAVPTAVPPTAVPPTAAPEATPAGPATIQIDEVTGFENTYDSWQVVGMLTNNTARIVSAVEIEVEVFDASGTSLYKETTYAELYALAPGETSPFSLQIYEDLPTADNFVATVIGNSTTDLERATPETRGVQMITDDDGDVHIVGEFVNNTSNPIQIGSLAGAIFDANGALITADSYNVSIRYLAPGEDGPFRISTTGPAEFVEAASYQLYVDAEVTDPIAEFGLSLSEAHDFLSYYGDFHLVGEVTNNGSETLNVSLLAALYDASGNIIDAASDDLAISALAPGESLPYDFSFWGPVNYKDGLSDSADTYSIQVDAYWTWTTDTQLVPLSTSDDTRGFDEYGGTFTGNIVNDSGGPIASATIVIYLRDKATGAVVATGYDFAFDELAAGATTGYTVSMDAPEGFDPSTVDIVIVSMGEKP